MLPHKFKTHCPQFKTKQNKTYAYQKKKVNVSHLGPPSQSPPLWEHCVKRSVSESSVRTAYLPASGRLADSALKVGLFVQLVVKRLRVTLA